MKTSLKKIFRNIVIGFAALFVIVVLVGGFLLIRALPSPEEIAQSFRGSSQKTQTHQNASAQQEASSSKSESFESESQETAVSKDSQKTEAQKLKDEKNEKLVRDFINEDLKDIRVCNNLGHSKILDEEELKTPEEKAKANFESWFGDDSRSDSLAETIRFPLKVILQDAAVRPLLEEIFSYEKDLPQDKVEKESFLQKVGFYGRLTTAVAGLYSKKDYFEHLSNRSIHLGVLTRIAHAKPQMRTDPRLNQLCQEMSQSLADGARVDIGREREEILTLIDEAGLTPEQVDFDPSAFVKFKIKSDHDQLQFSLTDKDEESSPSRD